MPFSTPERAVAVLRANFRTQLKPGEIVHWDSLEISGPMESTDLRGRTWFKFEASVRTSY